MHTGGINNRMALCYSTCIWCNMRNTRCAVNVDCDFQEQLFTFNRVVKSQGAKKINFTACPLGKL